MNSRHPWHLGVAVMIAVLSILTLVAAAVLGAEPVDWVDAAEQYGLLAADVVCALVGVRIVAHAPRHAVGWLLLIISLALAFSAFGGSSMVHLAVQMPAWVLHLTAASWFVTGGGLITLLMVMPTGRLLSRAWRAPLFALAGGLAVIAAAGLTAPVIEPSATPNPWAVAAVYDVAAVLNVVVAPALLLLGAVGGIASLAVRYHRAMGVERQRLKWLLFGGALFVGAQVSGVSALTGAGFAAIPVCCGIAIVRHGLFDIDRVISRTVGYAVITAVLLGFYAIGVVSMRAVLAPLAPDSDVAVAGSTLVVAAVFRPVARHVQTLVDRRFHRARYDSQQAARQFGQRLRDEVDLDQVADELAAVTSRTVAPSAVGIWLRPVPDRNGPVTVLGHRHPRQRAAAHVYGRRES